MFAVQTFSPSIDATQVQQIDLPIEQLSTSAGVTPQWGRKEWEAKRQIPNQINAAYPNACGG